MTLVYRFGSLDMTQEWHCCLDELAVRKSFVFLKENIIYEDLQDDLRQEGIVSEKEEVAYICQKPNRQSTCDRLIKHIIRKKRCKKFVDLMNRKSCFVAKKIIEVRAQVKEEATCMLDVPQRKPPFVVTDDLLQKHISCLHTQLEPREIADEMFQSGDITDRDHDAVTDPDRKYKRVTELLKILKEKKLYSNFVFTLQSLKYVQVLDTLENDRDLTKKPSACAVCIQQNFCLLKEELPGSRDAKIMVDQLFGFLDQTNISDIYGFTSAGKQKSKLLKVLLMKGEPACEELFRVTEVDLKREDLVTKMREKSAEMKKRGMPELDPKLMKLRITCLEKHRHFLVDELEPLELCDLLFEENALGILDHDRITETGKIYKQVQHLLETVKKDENYCFHYFLYILKSNGYFEILKELEKPDSEAERAESTVNLEWRASHSFSSIDLGSVENRPINVRLTVEGSKGRQEEQVFHQQVLSTDTAMNEEAITHGQMNIEDVSPGSVVIQLRPITDQAVQTLLNARENNRLVELILGMIKRVNVPSVWGTEPLEIRVQIYYSHSAANEPDIAKAELIKERIKIHRNEMIFEIEPRALTSVLSKSNCFKQNDLEAIKEAPTSHERTEKLLSLIENGESKTVFAFISALKNIGYFEIAELIDPAEIHSKAENIRKMITSNFKNILNEMQISLARETLSKCIGVVDTIQEKILPKNGKRRQRMTHFLQFILQEDHNLLEFEKVLKNNGLEDLLKNNENKHGEHIATEDIEVIIAEDKVPLSEGVLFESLLTLSPIDEDEKRKKYLEPLPTPWRRISLQREDPWTEEFKQELLQEIITMSPYGGISYINILLLGQAGSGVSSFFNTCLTGIQNCGRILMPRLVFQKSSSSYPTSFDSVPLSTKEGKILPLRIFECRGFNLGYGIPTEDIEAIVKGHVKSGYKINPVVPIKEEDRKYRRKPEIEQRMHGVVYVDSVENPFEQMMNRKTEEQLRRVRENLAMQYVPQMVLLNKVDMLGISDTRDIFRSQVVRDMCIKAAENMQITLTNVFPMSNYYHEISPILEKDILALFYLHTMMQRANDFIKSLTKDDVPDDF